MNFDIHKVISKVVGRKESLFADDLLKNLPLIASKLEGASIMILGAAGSIGREFTRLVAKQSLGRLFLIDLSENGLVELVRDLRGSGLSLPSNFATSSIGIDSPEFKCFLEDAGSFDFVANFAALKHVRAERDPFTLGRLLRVNVLANEDLSLYLKNCGGGHLFCVSSDKSVNPTNAMGASKAFMEMVLARGNDGVSSSTARFANVAFSDGSLPFGFMQRLAKGQPLVGPSDVRRCFLSPQESGELCLLSAFAAETGEAFFPSLSFAEHAKTFQEVAEEVLSALDLEPLHCDSSSEAIAKGGLRNRHDGKWPCFFTSSDTSGEKYEEEFFENGESVDFERFSSIGVAKLNLDRAEETDSCIARLRSILSESKWSKNNMLGLLAEAVPEFKHLETGRNLDQKL